MSTAPRYTTLAELRDAYASGQLTEKLWLDNDCCGVDTEDETLFESHPAQLLEDALDLLGIPHEHV